MILTHIIWTAHGTPLVTPVMRSGAGITLTKLLVIIASPESVFGRTDGASRNPVGA
jgi:hypothetical protein